MTARHFRQSLHPKHPPTIATAEKEQPPSFSDFRAPALA